MKGLAARPITWAIAGVLLVLAWWGLIVSANYGGKWSGLFCAGSRFPAPPELAAEATYTIPGSGGYDGQFYHFVAHDPWMQRGFTRFADGPRLRWRRIFVPAAAWFLALGRDTWVDTAYMAVMLAIIGLGIWWASLLAAERGLHPAVGLCFLIFPATIVTLDRMVVDGALGALTLAFIVYARRPGLGFWVLLAVAGLTRETGLLLTAGFCAAEVLARRWKNAAVFATAALPTLAWYGYVGSRIGPGLDIRLASPGWRLLRVFRSRQLDQYPESLFALFRSMDYVAILAMYACILLALWLFVRGPRTGVVCSAALFAATALWHQWAHAYDIGRVYTPMFILIGVTSNVAVATSSLIIPRVALLFAVQVKLLLRPLVSF